MRYVITGGAGYRLAAGRFPLTPRGHGKIVICDVASPQSYVPKTEFERVDARDRDEVRATMERAQPDALVHLAFILNPSHDETLMYDVDVNGTHNVLEAAAAAGTRQVLVTSSAAASGRSPTTRFRSPRTIRSGAYRASHKRVTRRSPIASASSGRPSTRTAR